MGKMKICIYCYFIADIFLDKSFLEMFDEWSSTKHTFCSNLPIWLVVMATKRLNLQNIYKTQFRSYVGDKAEILQKC